ncbi:glucose-1-phosphate thymidylyltransferase RfbA [Ottowia sp.]|uniref:glucose-1-phosphate thymidylyltransferase RfbA n=1 Tax=Ottowia sp. TaxID=1898956 RepID=UPI0025D63FED|nr:glucose-1-phosphate thymidylyltransferase RfbA [Ottowia sp.]MBK6616592.1 glucose-1-phosphate thymidylyltransferase RfbA [Ottowia sp.]
MRKGVVLAGGAGSRLHPATMAVNKQLLPVYDKPMIYYPLSTLMLAGIRDVMVITTEMDLESFRRLLGNGGQWGISISYAVQSRPDGIAHALLVASDFIAGEASALILGDNIFHGHDLPVVLRRAAQRERGASVFAYHVKDPGRYGVVSFGEDLRARTLVEKPKVPESNYAVTGLYFYDGRACELASQVKPSERGEMEITDLNRLYMEQGDLSVEVLGRGFAWLDTGTHQSLSDAGQFICTLESRQGLKVACLEEIAFRQGWIDAQEVRTSAERLKKSGYGDYLLRLLEGGAF